MQPIDPHLPYDPPEPFKSQALEWHGSDIAKKSDLLPSTSRSGFQRLTHHLYVQAASGLPPEVPEPTRRMVEALFDGEVASTDAAFGELVDRLKKEKLYDNTIIVFTSDHGEELIDRNWLGHMDTLYQELVHIPLVIKFAGQKWHGERSTEIWQQVDILPTVLDAIGLPALPEASGSSFPAGRLRVHRREGFFQVRAGDDAVEAGQSATGFLELGSGIRQGAWKLIHHVSSVKPVPPRGLYDLESDPLELTNRILDQPVKALRLERDLARRNAGSRIPKRASKGSASETRAVLDSLQYLR